MCCKEEGAISTLNSNLLKLVDQLTYLRRNISSTESDQHTSNEDMNCDWQIVYNMEIRFQGKNKVEFLPSCGFVRTIIWIYNRGANKTHRERVWRKLHEIAMCCFEQILKATPHETNTVRLLTSYLTKHPSKTNKTSEELLGKLERNLLQRSLVDSYTWMHQWWPTNYAQFRADTGCSREDPSWSNGWSGRDGGRESENLVLSQIR